MMMMRGGEKVKEFLRPLVDSRAWDLCVIWKLGDDPSRYSTTTLSSLHLGFFVFLFMYDESSAVYSFVFQAFIFMHY